MRSIHLPELERILYSSPVHHIHQIYELEHYGLSDERKTFFGAFSKNKLQAVLFSTGFHQRGIGFVISQSALDCAMLTRFGFSNGLKTIIGTEDYVKPILQQKLITGKTVKRWKVFKCGQEDLIPHHDYAVRKATINDIDRLVNIYLDYEFRAHDNAEDLRTHILEMFKSNNKYFVVEHNNQIIASALVYLETSYAAMVGAARVLPEYRGKGVFYSIRTAYIEYLSKKNKYAVGFFVESNFAVAKVITNSGGVYVEDWLVINQSAQKKVIKNFYGKAIAWIHRKRSNSNQ